MEAKEKRERSQRGFSLMGKAMTAGGIRKSFQEAQECSVL